MEEHLKKRPQKKVFSKEEINSLRNQAIDKIKSKLLPDDKIIKIVLIGSSVKNTFGEYNPPGFRGSLFSDFDFIVFIPIFVELKAQKHEKAVDIPAVTYTTVEEAKELLKIVPSWY